MMGFIRHHVTQKDEQEEPLIPWLSYHLPLVYKEYFLQCPLYKSAEVRESKT
jgi:hypothetical protein